MEVTLAIIFIGVLVFLAHLFAIFFERTKLPDVLPLIFIGLLIGPVLGLAPVEAFGKLGNVFTVIALVVILFEGGIGVDFIALKQSIIPGIKLTVINFVATTAILCPIAMQMLGTTFLEGLILGSILGGTSSVVVIPLVARLSLQLTSATALFLEATFSDVLCIVVTLGLIEAIQSQEIAPGLIIGQILASFLLAALIGAVAAVFWSSALRKIRQLENSIFLTPALVCIIYGITELLGYSGAIASLAFGTVLGNIQNLNLPISERLTSLAPININKKERDFFAEVVFLVKTFFFVYVGISIQLANPKIIFTSIAIILAIFLLRIPVVRLSFTRNIPKLDASVASVIAPKGLAAAVLASIPIQTGMENGIAIQETVYGVILFSIIATAALTFLMENGLLQKLYSLAFYDYSSSQSQSELG